jgi:hypothetical protein
MWIVTDLWNQWFRIFSIFYKTMEVVNEHINIDDFRSFGISFSEIAEISRQDNMLIEITPNDIILRNQEGKRLLLSSLLP